MGAATFRILSAAVVGALLGLLVYGVAMLATDDQTWSLAFGAAAFAVGVALSAMVSAPAGSADDDQKTKEH